MMAAVVARYGVVADRAPSFLIARTSNDFLIAVNKLGAEHKISPTEIAAIRRTKAYDGGDHVLWHIGKLDNLRKHQRLLIVVPFPTDASITQIYYAERLMLHSHAQNKTVLYRIPRGSFHPTKSNTSITAQIYLNETPSGVGTHPAMIAVRVYVERVKALIDGFP